MTQEKPANPIFEIKLAYAIEMDSGEKKVLFVREGSYCHFFDPIVVSGHQVNLRLDWADLDDEGRPTLDADFYNAVTRKRLKNSGDRRAAHHTRCSSASGREYEWIFDTARLRLKVVIHYMLDAKESILVADSVIADVRRNGTSRL